MKTTVHIEEYERGWGSRLDSVLEFDYLEDAQAFVTGFYSKNDKDVVPDWYMTADIVSRGDPIPEGVEVDSTRRKFIK